MAEDTDFAALYRELGIDPTCSFAELQRAWRRRVSKLHPDLGGDAEDTGRLQRLNRLYDAAQAFHARYGRLPGATAPATAAVEVDTPAAAGGWRRADDMGAAAVGAGATGAARSDADGIGRYAMSLHSMGTDDAAASGFGRIPRYFMLVSLIAIAVLGWRVAVHGGDGENISEDISEAVRGERERYPAQIATQASTAAREIATGMGKDTVRDIQGEPLDMHPLRWGYGPSWVEFRCDKVVGWYSSPLRPLRVSTVRADAPPPADHRCD